MIMGDVLMPRDEQAIELIETFGLASTSQLAATVYKVKKASEDVARRRLRILHESGHLQRIKYGQNSEYCYYRGKRPPEQREHRLLLLDTYIGLLGLGIKISSWEAAPSWGSLIPDAYCAYSYKGIDMHLAVEVQRKSHAFDQQKYEADYRVQKRLPEGQRRWKNYPAILVVSEKVFTPAPTELKIVVVPISLEGLSRIL